MKLLNKAQADELFQRVAILIGSHDVVPVSVAVELFGEDAVDFALHHKTGYCWNIFSTSKGSCQYLTYSGFQAAASYYNVLQTCEVKK